MLSAGRKVSDKCLEDLLKLKMDASSNINKNVPLGACVLGWWGRSPRLGSASPTLCRSATAASPLAARACKDDVAKLCKDANDMTSPGSIVHCLR